MVEHSDLPWGSFSHEIANANRRTVCDCCGPDSVGEDIANANFIVRAVNNHDALVDLIQTLMDNDPDEPVADNGMTVIDAWRERAMRVLAQVIS